MPISQPSDKIGALDNIYVGFGMSIDRLSLWQIHVRLIETGSFSAVAKKLATSQPAGGKADRPSRRSLACACCGDHAQAVVDTRE